jgi:hypothetical protein
MSVAYWNKRKSPTWKRESGYLLDDRDHGDDDDLGLRHISYIEEEKKTCGSSLV